VSAGPKVRWGSLEVLDKARPQLGASYQADEED